MSKNLPTVLEIKLTAQLTAQLKLQQEAKIRLDSQNKAAAREILLRVQLILSRNQIK